MQANVLKALREARKLSQKELAEKAGVHELTVLRLEKEDGLASATVDTLAKLAKALGVPTAALCPF